MRNGKKFSQAFGGEIIFTHAEESLSGSLKKMQEITQAEPEKYFVVNQFVNPHNPEVHYVLDVNLVDMVFTVSNEEAIETTRRLSKEEGLLVETSSGANVFAALQMDSGRNRVVTILPNRAERYFSTALL